MEKSTKMIETKGVEGDNAEGRVRAEGGRGNGGSFVSHAHAVRQKENQWTHGAERVVGGGCGEKFKASHARKKQRGERAS